MASKWEIVKLGDICDKIGSGATPKGGKDAYCSKGISLIRSQNVLDFAFSEDGLAYINDEQARKLNNVEVKSGDVLLNITGDSVARACMVEDNYLPARVNQHVAIIRGNAEKATSSYLLYFLQMEKPHLLQLASAGATRNALTKGMIEQLQLVLPPLDEQRRIVGLLDALQRKIRINNKVNDNLQQQLRAIFMERFTNNPALESIQQVPLSELCSVVTKGTTPTTLGKPFVDRGINFLKAESILDNHSLDKGKFAHIDEETHDMLKRSVIYAGDIVFTIAGTLGRFALIDSDILPANTNQAVAIIRADKGKISPEYLYTCFIGNWHNDYYSKRVQQAVQANLSLTTIKSLPIPVLTQDEMVSYMAIISPIIRMLKQNEMENERLAALRDTLLPRLMSGEVDVSNIDI